MFLALTKYKVVFIFMYLYIFIYIYLLFILITCFFQSDDAINHEKLYDLVAVVIHCGR